MSERVTSYRSSVSGRKFPVNFAHATPQAAITNFSDPREVQDLAQNEEEERRLAVHQYLKEQGYDSIFHLCAQILLSPTDHEVKDLNSWMGVDGPASFLAACVAHPKFKLSDRFAEEVCSVAVRVYKKEMAQLATSDEFKSVGSSYSLQDVVRMSFDKAWQETKDRSRHLAILLQSLVEYPRRGIDASDTSLEHDEGRILPEGLNDEGEGDHEDSEGTEGDSDGMEGPATVPQDVQRRHRRRQRWLTVVTAGLVHCRSQKKNLLAANVGYFLFASKTPKRVIEIIHRLGLSISYESIVHTLRRLAKQAAFDLRKWAASCPAFFISFDNLNFYAHVRDQRLLNRNQMINYTAGYIAINPWTRAKDMFPSSAVDYTKMQSLNADTFLLSDSEHGHMRRSFQGLVSATLHKYCEDSLRSNNERREPLKPFTIPKIHPLPAGKTKIFMLPTFDKNEGKVEEITQILRSIIAELGYSGEQLLKDEKLIMIKGDFLTVRNIR